MLKSVDWNKYIIDGECDIIKYKSKYPSTDNSIDFYNNILLTCFYHRENSFHSILAVDKDSEKYVTNSNSYIEDHMYNNKSYDDTYKIYTRLNVTYDLLMKKKISDTDIINILDECILFANPFSGVNSGHDLSIVLNAIQYYITKSLTCKVIVHTESLKIPRILEMIDLWIPKSKLLFIDYDKYYYLKSVHMPKQEYFHIFKHVPLINNMKSLILDRFYDPDEFKNKKIVLIKNKSNVNVVRSGNCYYCQNLFKSLENTGWIIINPEKMSMYKIAMYIMYAKKIILSGGAITYTHIIYMNDKLSDIYFIGRPSMGDYIYCGLKHKYIQVDDINLDNLQGTLLETVNNTEFTTTKLII